jgi:hypothetical protein
MDTFCEQIVSIKKSNAMVVLYLALWILAILICVAAFLFLIALNPIVPLFISVAVLFGTYKLLTMFNVEYEYIITNGTLDIDKIINKSKRIRLTSVELGTVSQLEKYNPRKVYGDAKEVPFACNKTSPNAYFICAQTLSGKTRKFVFAPNEKLKEAMIKFMPKFISNSAFKD